MLRKCKPKRINYNKKSLASKPVKSLIRFDSTDTDFEHLPRHFNSPISTILTIRQRLTWAHSAWESPTDFPSLVGFLGTIGPYLRMRWEQAVPGDWRTPSVRTTLHETQFRSVLKFKIIHLTASLAGSLRFLLFFHHCHPHNLPGTSGTNLVNEAKFVIKGLVSPVC